MEQSNNDNHLNDIYDDFFQLLSSNPEMATVLKEKTSEKITVPNNKLQKMKVIFKKIDNSNLTLESQSVLKKMIDYAKKFEEGIVKKYIPFNMRIYCDNDETVHSIINLILEGFKLFNYIKNDEYVEKSFFAIDESKQILELYNSENSLVVLKDVKGLLNQDKAVKDKILNSLENKILDYSSLYGITTIITDKTQSIIDELFSNSLTLKDKIFDFELFTDKADNHEVYQTILNYFKKDYIVTADFELQLLDYVTETYTKTSLSAPEYSSAVIEKILFNQTDNIIRSESLPPFEKNKSITEIFKDLNSLVGLENIKIMLKDLVNLNEFKKKTTGELDLKNTNLHMVFLGNPGTGKTTVARIVAGILYNIGFVKQNKLIEVSAKDLIGQYVGQTAPKTLEVIQKAIGGVLFIDEAYSLTTKPGNTNSFNEECIATLIQEMENNRDNLVVIFAGYSKEMQGFLKSNSGIVSRIGYTMEFKDYSIDELITIFTSMFEKTGFIVDDQALKKAEEIISEYMKNPDFGNARFVRNLYEKTIIKHATNTENEIDKIILKTITENDISAENLG